jgi:hypothetical protein
MTESAHIINERLSDLYSQLYAIDAEYRAGEWHSLEAQYKLARRRITRQIEHLTQPPLKAPLPR